MNVTVFGATGQIGRLVVADLLAGGHRATAYVRNPAKLQDASSGLAIVTGELSDAERIRRAVHGADAVISALGPSLRRGAEGKPVTEGKEHRRCHGTLRVGFLGRDKVGSTMSRADIAAFLVAQLSDHAFSRAAPTISN